MEVPVDGFWVVSRRRDGTALEQRLNETYMAERMLLRKSCFSFCSGLGVRRQDGVFYEFMFDGFGRFAD